MVPTALTELLAGWGGRLAAADPARQRVRLASRAAGSLGLALAVMAPVGTAAGQPVTILMLSGIVAMVSAASVKDGTRAQALVTIGESGLISLAVVATAAALSGHPMAADIVFLAVMTGAVLLRKYGDRGFALGQLAFMTYFFALFLQARVHQLPWMAVAVAVGVAATALVRCVLLPDRPASDLRRSVRALEARIAELADQIRVWLAADPNEREARTRLLVRAGSRLGEVALLVERELESAAVAGFVDDVEALRGKVFDVEVAAERLVDAVRRDGPGLTDRVRVRFEARAGRLAVAARAGRPVRADHRSALAVTARAVTPRADDAPVLAAAFARVESGLGDLTRVVVRTSLLDGFASPVVTDAQQAQEPTVERSPVDREGISLPTRTAVQVALAGALSIAAGKAISPERWFWAVVASYVVFINAKTRTATVRRAFGRVAGTVLGVIAGLLLGKAVTGDPHLAVALIVVLVFAGFWLVLISYTALVFCFTLTIAALYSILGTLSFSLMRLRIEETIAGAVIGGVVSVVVLPRRGSAAVDEDIDAVLAAAGDLLDEVVSDNGEGQPAVRARVRLLDRAFQDLRSTMAPTIVGVPGSVPQSRRRQLLHVAAIRYWARTVALTTDGRPPLRRVEDTRSHIEQVRQLVRYGGHLELPGGEAPDSEDAYGSALAHLDDALHALVAERG